TSTIAIGAGAAAGNIDIGTNATARTITVGNAIGATKLDLDGGTDGIDVDTKGVLSLDGEGGINIGITTDYAIDVDASTLDIDASGAVTIDGTSTIAIGAGAAAGNIDIGINATAREITIGNNTTDAGITMVTGTGGIPINAEGDITIDAGTTSAISLDASASSNLTATAENAVLTVAAVGGGASQKLVLNSAGTGAEGVLIATTGDAGGITVNASSGNADTDDFVVVAHNFSVSATGVVTATEFSAPTGTTETG
ncbi:uncharacterized protein METZ01_LOCUS455285, partial [marine metagenome]